MKTRYLIYDYCLSINLHFASCNKCSYHFFFTVVHFGNSLKVQLTHRFTQDNSKRAFNQQDIDKGSKSHNNISEGEPAGALYLLGGSCAAFLRHVCLLLLGHFKSLAKARFFLVILLLITVITELTEKLIGMIFCHKQTALSQMWTFSNMPFLETIFPRHDMCLPVCTTTLLHNPLSACKYQ